jgi:hypothetical protein
MVVLVDSSSALPTVVAAPLFSNWAAFKDAGTAMVAAKVALLARQTNPTASSPKATLIAPAVLTKLDKDSFEVRVFCILKEQTLIII